MQQWIRWEKIEELENSKLIQVTVSRSSINWIKEEKELLIGGKLFDVKSIIEKDGQIILTGLYDQEETAIINAINGQTASSKEDTQLRTTFICTLLMCVSIPAKQLDTSISLPSISFLPVRNTPLHLSPILDQLTPPPQC
jgi:hypothetical protein